MLKNSLVRHPNDRDSLLALVNFSREAGDLPSALLYAERLALMFPDDQSLARMVKELRQQ